jgi:formyl-CoA transferase
MRGLLESIGQPELLDDPRFSGRGPRMRNAAVLNEVIAAWTSQRSSSDVVRELLDKHGVPCAPVRKPTEVLHDRRLHDSGALMHLAHPDFGPVDAVGMGLPIRFSATPSQFDQPAMALGRANEEIYGGLLKLSREEIGALREEGVV